MPSRSFAPRVLLPGSPSGYAGVEEGVHEGRRVGQRRHGENEGWTGSGPLGRSDIPGKVLPPCRLQGGLGLGQCQPGSWSPSP
jgi:hypothetical protein